VRSEKKWPETPKGKEGKEEAEKSDAGDCLKKAHRQRWIENGRRKEGVEKKKRQKKTAYRFSRPRNLECFHKKTAFSLRH